MNFVYLVYSKISPNGIYQFNRVSIWKCKEHCNIINHGLSMVLRECVFIVVVSRVLRINIAGDPKYVTVDVPSLLVFTIPEPIGSNSV